ncbi:N-acetylmuramoyl-L-alanine amidase [Amphibiibacter pelophylacis]|uniref:N-acetylmuramoyl-L-alanine amidase n=1 Tax=Amphibiibacter pelophylacis TaxID=1799477 RepID=A0ACC6P3H5_9BURK
MFRSKSAPSSSHHPQRRRWLRQVATGVAATALPRTGLLGAAVSALWLGPAQLAFGATAVAVRLWPAPDYTRLTIESDGKLSATHTLQDGGQALRIRIPGLALNDALSSLSGRVLPGDPFIAALQVSAAGPDAVQLDLRLKQPVRPEQFALAPVATYQNRLVFDLHPVQVSDPLLALIREKSGTQASDDALRDFLAQRHEQVAQEDELSRFINGALEERLNGPKPPVVASATPRPPARSSGRPARPAPAAPPAELREASQAVAEARNSVNGLTIVMIDPGHGGEDPGAIGPSGLMEKTVVLAVGTRLANLINSVPGMKAFMTRDADFFVPLGERVRKSQHVQADLFMSIHADAVANPRPKGGSVYALSTRGATSSTARYLQGTQNASDIIGGVSSRLAHDRSVMRAMLDMSTTAQIKDSTVAAQAMLGHLGRIGDLHKKGVEYANFAVLRSPSIPSILVETAFISNPEEEALLATNAYRETLAQALFSGVRGYFSRNPPASRRRIA